MSTPTSRSGWRRLCHEDASEGVPSERLSGKPLVWVFRKEVGARPTPISASSDEFVLPVCLFTLMTCLKLLLPGSSGLSSNSDSLGENHQHVPDSRWGQVSSPLTSTVASSSNIGRFQEELVPVIEWSSFSLNLSMFGPVTVIGEEQWLIPWQLSHTASPPG